MEREYTSVSKSKDMGEPVSPEKSIVSSSAGESRYNNQVRGRMLEQSIKQYKNNIQFKNVSPSKQYTDEQITENQKQEVPTARQVLENGNIPQKQQTLVKQVANNLKHKVEAIKVKRKIVASERARTSQSPFFSLFMEVLKQHAIDLPLLEMVKNSTL